MTTVTKEMIGAIAIFFTAITVGIWYVEGELDFWLAIIFGG